MLSNERYIGRVKWFNNRAGYGFLTVSGGEKDNTDVFVHHSSLSVAKEQYRYLVQGEYVHFSMKEMDQGDHKWQADNVKGINDGMLMCETKNEMREQRNDLTESDDSPAPRKQHRRVRRGGGGPREGNNNEVWELVKTSERKRNRSPSITK